MKLNTNSNAYIIIYSAILVVIVAFLLAVVYQALKPMQDANVALDVKKQRRTDRSTTCVRSTVRTSL